MKPEEVQDLITADREGNDAQNQFGVAQIPFHTHNGLDSQQVSFTSLVNRSEFVEMVLPGTSAATSGNYGVFWIAPYSCNFIGATEVHGHVGGASAAIQIEHLSSTTASGGGTALLAAAFDLTAAANKVQTATLAALTRASFNIAKGDRLGLVASGTLTAATQVVVVCQLSY